jgi:hypothetical protein
MVDGEMDPCRLNLQVQVRRVVLTQISSLGRSHYHPMKSL